MIMHCAKKQFFRISDMNYVHTLEFIVLIKNCIGLDQWHLPHVHASSWSKTEMHVFTVAIKELAESYNCEGLVGQKNRPSKELCKFRYRNRHAGN